MKRGLVPGQPREVSRLAVPYHLDEKLPDIEPPAEPEIPITDRVEQYAGRVQVSPSSRSAADAVASRRGMSVPSGYSAAAP